MTCLADKTNHPVKRLKSTAELLVGTLSACIQPEYWIQLPREQDVDLECRRSPKYVLMCRARPSVLHLQQGPPKVSFNCFQPAQVSFNWCIQPTQVSFICSITRPASSVLNCFRPARVSLHSQRHLPHHTSPPHLLWHNFSLYPLNTCCHISPPELGKVPHSRGLCPNWADRVPTRPVSV